MELTCVRLLVDKFDECFRFYHEILGFEPVFGKMGDVYALFNAGKGFGIELFNIQLMSSEIGTLSLPAPVKQQDIFSLSIHDDAIDQTYKTLKEKGVQFINEPHDMPGWGMRVVHFRDPCWNLIEINQGIEIC
jgi:lactoylglutathione lyase